jgi:hypothetical protein
MTNENSRNRDMLIGNHFGKRKPQWNFFIKSYENFKYSASAQLVKMLALSLIVQTILFTPVIFWIYQNYAIIESLLPAHLNLDENIQFEKKWIVFLIFGMSLFQCFWNYTIWKAFIKNDNFEFQNSLSPVKPVSLDEADYQRRAS